MVVFIAFIGVPGCGKGTQIRLLQEKYHFLQVSVGQILRDKGLVKGGVLLDSQTVVREVREYIDKNIAAYEKLPSYEPKKGVRLIMDGYPRKMGQYRKFEFSITIFLDISEEEACGRILKRNEGRSDDNLITFKKRMNEYHTKTKPVVECLKKSSNFIRIDGSKSINEIHEDICNELAKADSYFKTSNYHE